MGIVRPYLSLSKLSKVIVAMCGAREEERLFISGGNIQSMDWREARVDASKTSMCVYFQSLWAYLLVQLCDPATSLRLSSTSRLREMKGSTFAMPTSRHSGI